MSGAGQDVDCFRASAARRRAARRRAALSLALVVVLSAPGVPAAATYYQTVGDDARDGLTPQTAWQHLSKLSSAMHAGDVAYVGPGLYREEIVVENDGAPDARIVFVADATGQHTGDPPGTVMVTGADPVDGTIFVPHTAPGVYTARIPSMVWGAVEMDGPQYRYGGPRRPGSSWWRRCRRSTWSPSSPRRTSTTTPI